MTTHVSLWSLGTVFLICIYRRPYHLLHAQVMVRVAFLVATRAVPPRRGRTCTVLLTLNKTSVEYTVIVNDLPLLSHCELLC
jgi:hypothetical protein